MWNNEKTRQYHKELEELRMSHPEDFDMTKMEIGGYYEHTKSDTLMFVMGILNDNSGVPNLICDLFVLSDRLFKYVHMVTASKKVYVKEWTKIDVEEYMKLHKKYEGLEKE